MKQKEENIQGTEKEFIDLFKELTTSRSDWQVWSDLMAVMACTLSNVLDTDEKRKADREKEYTDSIARLGGVEIPAKVLEIQNIDGTKANVTKVKSGYDSGFVYEVGKTVSVDNFCEDRWEECSSGIHFFINRQEAVNY